MVVQLLLFTLYCRVEPAGQGVPVGAVMLPPDTTLLLQVLLTMPTLAGAPLKLGQVAAV
ncbi:MAG TPA: hypothetical protein PK198_21825 [Saprospiraceae bacterium]|nr:hypothetical protein [Saprospiraceae bacterium]